MHSTFVPISTVLGVITAPWSNTGEVFTIVVLIEFEAEPPFASVEVTEQVST